MEVIAVLLGLTSLRPDVDRPGDGEFVLPAFDAGDVWKQVTHEDRIAARAASFRHSRQ